MCYDKGMSNIVLDYLKNHTLAELRENHGVRYGIRGHLVTLAYDQFEASLTDEIACMCRGMVLTDDSMEVIRDDVPLQNARILAFPFIRFFNYGQLNFVFKPVKVYEKLDGTMIVMYFDDRAGIWQFGTRNVPDGSNVSNVSNTSFRALCLRALREHYNFPNSMYFWEAFNLNKGMTYIFELMTPENKVVVNHTDYKICLIGARYGSEKNFEEVSVEQAAKEAGFDFVVSHSMNLKADEHEVFENIVKFANVRDPKCHEGFVVLGENWQRLKVKSAGYVSFSKIHDLNKYDILTLILRGEMDDYMPLLHDYQRTMVMEISDKLSVYFRNLHHKITEMNHSMSGFANRREFADYVKQEKMFSMYAKSIFRAFSENRAIMDSSELVEVFYNSTNKEYSRGFLKDLLEAINV